jgi:phage tail sheath protein FI
MSQIVPQNAFNIASLAVDDVYIVIVPPGPRVISGVLTNVAGPVGTASWGPVNSPVRTGSPQEVLNTWGPIYNDKYDLATAAALCSLGGTNALVCVRVTDGTDEVATVDVDDTQGPTALLTLSAKYTGSAANSAARTSGSSASLKGIMGILQPGSKAGTLKFTLQFNGTSLPKEVYDNLPADNTFKDSLASAINSGQGPLRPPSLFVTASVNAANTTGTPPTPATVASTPVYYYFAGGTDGRSGVTDASSVGSPTGSLTSGPSGMYALENMGVMQFCLVGVTDMTKAGTIIDFAQQNGMLAILSFAQVTTTAEAISSRADNGIDNPFLMLIKDFVWWYDPVNQITRVLASDSLALGLIANLSPEQGVGNKPIYGIIGTDRTVNNQPYTVSEIAQLESAGVNFFTNPIPAGSVFGLRHNQNSSSDGTVNGCNWTRMTSFLARSFAAGLGPYVGRVQSSRANDQLRSDARATISTFLTRMRNPAVGEPMMIDDFTLVLDETNNTVKPVDTIGLGFLNAYVAVRYLAVVRFFVFSLQAGQTVQVSVSATPPAGVGGV